MKKKSNLKKILVIIFIFLIYFIYKENFKPSYISHVSLEEDKLCYITQLKNLHCNVGVDRFNKKSLKEKNGLFLLTNATKISSGRNFTCVIDKRNDLYCFGKNNFNQLGNGKGLDEALPVKILSDIRQVSLGDYHACAIDKENKLYCWGAAIKGELGFDFKKPKNTVKKPRETSLKNVNKVSCNESATCALLKNNDIYCWGDEGRANLYLSNKYTDIKDITSFELTANGLCLINKNNILNCYMLDTIKNIQDKKEFEKLKPFTIKSVKKISSKLNNACVLMKNNQAFCFGDNKDGQLGGANDNQDRKSNSFLPEEKVKEIYVGFSDVCVITRENKISCKGKNYFGDF